MNPASLALLLPLALLAPLALPGCASAEPTEVPPQARRDLDELRAVLVEARQQIGQISATTRALDEPPEGQQPPAVAELVGQIGALEELRTKTVAVHARAQASARQYFEDWERELATMPTDLAEKGRERRAHSLASCASLEESARRLASAFDHFMAGLLECKRYLDTDSTPQGFQVVLSRLEDQLEQAEPLQEQIDEVVAHVDVMRGGS